MEGWWVGQNYSQETEGPMVSSVNSWFSSGGESGRESLVGPGATLRGILNQTGQKEKQMESRRLGLFSAGRVSHTLPELGILEVGVCAMVYEWRIE
jgi:hypothetical protein